MSEEPPDNGSADEDAACGADFAVHGADVIAAVRADDPLQYMKLIAALLPKDGMARKADDAPPRDAFAHLSDDELLARIRSLEAAIDESTSSSAADGDVAPAGGAQAQGRRAAAVVLPALP